MSNENGSNLPVLAQNYNIMTMDKGELIEVIQENVGGQLSRLDLPTVRVPTAGGTSWTIPDESGDHSDKVLRGIVVYQTVARGYWEETFDSSGGGTPPTCYSNDGKNGTGNPGGSCATCPLNQWGSDRRGGNGKACREMRLLFMIQEGDVLPFVVALPPTSVKNAHQYFVRLATKGTPYFGVMTEVSLEQTKSNGGIKYSQAAFKMAGRLAPEQVAHIKAYREALVPTLSQVRVEAEEVAVARWTPAR